MSDFDSPWKEALDHYFEPFLAFFFPQAHADIDWGRGHEPLDKELQQIVREAELGRRLVDKLVKVWRKSGREEWVLVHVEVQGHPETDFEWRMYVYHYRLFDRYNRRVVSLAVLTDERESWRPDHFRYDLWGCSLDFRFPVVKLLDFKPVWQALEVNPNPFATVVLAHLKALETRDDPGQRQAWKLRLVKQLYDRGLNAGDVRQLFRFIDWMLDLPEALQGLFRAEVHQYEEERRMPYITSFERFGRCQGLLRGIEVSLELKFGEEGLKLMPEISELHDHEVLQAILQAIKTATAPDELRRIWAP